MKSLLKFLCILTASLAILTGCSDNQDKSGQEGEKKTAQSETSDKKESENIQNTTEESIELSDEFNGINGCAVLYSPSEKKYFLYNKNMAKQEVSPYSTFKIISALSGLRNDILKDETSVMNYNGTKYPNPEWNGSLTMKEAFRTSCIWYFRQVIDAVGKDKVKKELDELGYGNCDVTEWEGSNINPYDDLNGFWLNSSLKISPFEQVKVLTGIFEGNSIYSSEDPNILKKIMLIQDRGTQQIYGKTGSGANGEAWFTGFAETKGKRKYFAVYINDHPHKEQISGSSAEEIALKIMERLK